MAEEPVGPPIAAGRDADVFVLADQRVLRRCRNASHECEREAEIMEWARRNGLPVPRVFSVAEPEMVLERIRGSTMVEEMAAGLLDPATVGRRLAELLRALQALPAALGRPPEPGCRSGHRAVGADPGADRGAPRSVPAARATDHQRTTGRGRSVHR